jgi:hypothetical protein
MQAEESVAMRSLFSTDPWLWSYGFESTIDFCVWALETDGLRVPPFDQHPDGNGELRLRGLTAAAREAWFREVVRMVGDDEARRIFWTMVREKMRRRGGPVHLPSPPFMDPMAAWHGPAEVGALLAEWHRLPPEMAMLARERWSGYPRVGNQRHEVEHGTIEMRHDVTRQLWRELKPYHRCMPRLRVHVVAYPTRVQYVAPPDAVVLGLSEPFTDPMAFRQAVLGAAEAVAKANDGPEPQPQDH